MATVYDIAKAAGVSPASVSRVLNQREGVGKKTTEKILKTMEELNFKPRWQAGKANCIGFVIFPHKDCLAHVYNAQILSAASEVLFAQGYHVQLIPQTQTDEAYNQLQHMVTTHQVDGVMIMGFHQSYDLARRVNVTAIPHVVIGDSELVDPANQICTMSEQGGERASEYLYQLGHRRFAIVTPSFHDNVHRKRTEGIKRALSRLGVPQEQVHHLVVPDVQYQMGESAAAELCSKPDRATAVILTDSTLAIGFVRGCRKMNVKVPEQLSVLGFEVAGELEHIDPPVTAMNALARNMGETAARRLLDQIHNESITRQTNFDMMLIVRQSTASIA